MEDRELLPKLFKSELQKIISEVRCLFAIEIETAKDLVGDTFLSASEFWKKRGLPENPTAWLHTVAKNKARNYLKRKAFFNKKLSPELKLTPSAEEIEIDLSKKAIDDNQLAMIFTICNPCISSDAQVSLALNLICGFGVQEIADAYLTTTHVIYKRLERAKEKLKMSKIKIQQPTASEINIRQDNVLTTLYLLFSEGYFSLSENNTLRESFCTEAMRLNYLLIENTLTNTPSANALFALMCFHSSRFVARTTPGYTVISYEDQDETLWDKGLINKGRYYLNIAARGKTVSKFHLEAGIAYWHTQKADTREKWESILDLYNKLLDLECSPVAALNRTYALAKVKGKAQAIMEAESLNLTGNPFYHSLLNFLHNGFDGKTLCSNS